MATHPESKFDKKLKELVKEFNDNKFGELRAKGDDFGLYDFFLELNCTRMSTDYYELIMPFVKKYKGSIGISPVKYNDCICIRIDDRQFNL